MLYRESAGVLQFNNPRAIRAIQEYDNNKWVFVEGSETGILMEELNLIERGSVHNIGAPPILKLSASNLTLETGWREEKLLDDNGEEIFIKYKGEPTIGRYQFIHDYCDFKLKRFEKDKK